MPEDMNLHECDGYHREKAISNALNGKATNNREKSLIHQINSVLKGADIDLKARRR